MEDEKSAIIPVARIQYKPFHHFDVKAEALVNRVCPPPNAGLELEHLRRTHHQTVLSTESTKSS